MSRGKAAVPPVKIHTPAGSSRLAAKLAGAVRRYTEVTGLDPLKGESPVSATKPRHFLGFDCATKTLAYGIISIDLERYAKRRVVLWLLVLKAVRGLLSPAELVRLNAETRGFIRIPHGAVTDLFPGRRDASISTVERIRGLAEYVEGTIMPKVAGYPGIEPVVEFQMGPNAPARTIAASLITLFHKYKVFIVGPSLKNKVALCEEGRYCYFIEKYKKAYDANKAHAKFNFAELERLFPSAIPPTKPAALRGHIADSVMQILGYLMFGNTEDPEKSF